jgi:hypothetical protein
MTRACPRTLAAHNRSQKEDGHRRSQNHLNLSPKSMRVPPTPGTIRLFWVLREILEAPRPEGPVEQVLLVFQRKLSFQNPHH